MQYDGQLGVLQWCCLHALCKQACYSLQNLTVTDAMLPLPDA